MAQSEIENRMVTCVTCSIARTVAGENAEVAVWDCSWNVNLLDEEQEAFDHSKANPNHIMVDAIDYGFKVNRI